MDMQTDINLLRPQMTLRNMNSGNIFYMPLTSFAEMWYQIFLWALFSSIFVHTIAGAICFATLRQHKYGLAATVGSPPSTRIVSPSPSDHRRLPGLFPYAGYHQVH
ncbi:transmembrane protein 170A isoform X4 [Monomorium pharaonis]|uniref:transmembrane protein 170A isoform X4 n=1 Tax=Monomorium pharaonis TaxID=307658 RepID=UPI00063F9DB9|nr:transmembrane protein 170A isoform X4 [Monomorium pharaonis]